MFQIDKEIAKAFSNKPTLKKPGVPTPGAQVGPGLGNTPEPVKGAQKGKSLGMVFVYTCWSRYFAYMMSKLESAAWKKDDTKTQMVS